MNYIEANLTPHRRHHTDAESAAIKAALSSLLAARQLLDSAGEHLKSSRIGLMIAELEGDLKYGQCR